MRNRFDLLIKQALGVLLRPAGAVETDAEVSPDAMEIWEKQLRDEGIRQGLERGLAAARQSLLLFYENRFGAVPPAVRTRVEATSDLDTLMRWTECVVRDAREDVDRDLSAG